MSTSCNICKKELTNDVSVIRGIGPICRAKALSMAEKRRSQVCDYDVEFYNDAKIVVIHELSSPNDPKISLTNCIEYVIKEIVAGYKLCPGIWSFVEHPSPTKELFGVEHEYDLVSVDGESVEWRYLWHSAAKGEIKNFSRSLIIDRVNAYRKGEKKVLGRPLPTEMEVAV